MTALENNRNYLRSPTPAEVSIVNAAMNELVLRNHTEKNIPFILCCIVCCIIGIISDQVYLLWVFVPLMALMLLLSKPQKQKDISAARQIHQCRYTVACIADLAVVESGWSVCDVTLYPEGSMGQAICAELDMKKEDILSGGCEQFLLLALENRDLLIQKTDSEVNVYDVHGTSC